MKPADDYVRSFVRDVARLQVLKLRDIMSPAKAKPKGAAVLDAATNLEAAMIAIAEGASGIAVTQDGKLVGKVSRSDITAAINLD